uniref:Nephrocystin-3 n=1 Tax=Talaromyces marneffei PM1 TaxID=1077442 RepID=A0A093Y520_TALMA
MYQQALEGKKKALGPDHTSTLNTINNLGLLYSDQGKLKKAKKVYQQRLEDYKKGLGPDHNGWALEHAKLSKPRDCDYIMILSGREIVTRRLVRNLRQVTQQQQPCGVDLALC